MNNELKDEQMNQTKTIDDMKIEHKNFQDNLVVDARVHYIVMKRNGRAKLWCDYLNTKNLDLSINNVYNFYKSLGRSL